MNRFDISTRILTAICTVGLLFLMAAFFLPEGSLSGWGTGYGLGATTIFLHFIVIHYLQKVADDLFFKLFFFSFVVRFLIVFAIFLLVLISGKIDQISFTVSFIISYICHSVIEIIEINKKITNRTG